jgi:hypothetical protein
MIRLLRVATVIVALAALAACGRTGGVAARTDLKNLSDALHECAGARTDATLHRLRIDGLGLDDLSELRARYYSDYVEPRMSDEVTDGIGRIIEARIGRLVRLRTGGRSLPPTLTYVIDAYDPVTYQGRLEDGFADDSLHVREFPEAFGQRFVAYRPGDSIKISLDSRFRFLVAPRSYRGHSWEAVDLALDERGSFKLSPDLGQSLVFAIVAADIAPKRQYKVVWALGYGGIPSR